MMRTDDSSITAGTVLLEVAQYAEIKLELNHETKETGDLKTELLCIIGENNAKINLDITTTVYVDIVRSILKLNAFLGGWTSNWITKNTASSGTVK